MGRQRMQFVMLLVLALVALTLGASPVQAGPGGGTYYANSPAGGTSGVPLRKFVDSLPGLGPAGANNLGQYIPIANKMTNPVANDNADYYEIGLVDYTERMHSDLPKATKLRGYIDLSPAAGGAPAHYLGPLIIATKNKPVRVKFTNYLPAGTAGDLFIPVDNTYMGAGLGPIDNTTLYTQNRATLHLHGGNTPWISDGTPHQWITPAAETSIYKTGVTQHNVPDMANPGSGSSTFYWTNQQSGRLMFYHDHAYGLTRLNVYAGEAAGFLLTDPIEDNLVTAGIIPSAQVPLIIQDKTFVPVDVALQDALWDTVKWGQPGDLWFPHVYEPNQDPASITGANPFGRWDYGPWFFPPMNPATLLGPLPTVSGVPEGFMDTPIVNGTAYPYLTVQPQKYRFRILNACNDRMLNLQMYQADNTILSGAPGYQTEVKMIPAVAGPAIPAYYPTMDGRAGGVPDPALAGPAMIQIGSEGGLLPGPVLLNNVPVGFDYNRRNIVVLNVLEKTLFMGPAERADIIVDFSQYAGKTVILYNDAPAPVPAFDPRNDYYTGNVDQSVNGGAPPTLPGYGPNTRTIMQFRVAGTPSATPSPINAYDNANLTALQTALPTAFAAAQPVPIVPQAGYGPAYGATYTDTYAKIQDTSYTFTPAGSTASVTVPMQPKAIQELFELNYGRMNATLGVELPLVNFVTQTTIPYGYIDPATEKLNDGETQIWKITHNGVDTHAIHFHLVNVQVINRVGWDGAIRPPDPNELGWKETVRMHPLEDIIVAVQAKKQTGLPFALDNSWHPLDVTQPTTSTMGFTALDPYNNPITVTNDNTNFGQEYVWHCHLLGHEENDMMRPLIFREPETAPNAPTSLTATRAALDNSAINLAWTDNVVANWGVNAYRVERKPTAGGPFAAVATVYKNADLRVTTQTFVDRPPAPSTSYDYRVFAFNAKGDSGASNTATASTGAFAAAGAVTMVPNPASPQLSGTQVLWTATATGGTGTYQYEFWLFTGGVWNVVKPYTSGGNSWLWDTTGLANGTYSLRVYARNAGSLAASQAIANVTYTLGAKPATLVTLSPNPPAPQLAGTSILWTAIAGGGTGPYEYQIWQYSNATYSWSIVKSYATAGNTFTANTTGLNPGTYYWAVWARNVGSTAAYETYQIVPYSIVSPSPPTGASLTSFPASPQAAGTQVVWTAASTGGLGLVEYQIWQYSTATYTWSIVKPYATAGSTYTWNTTGLGPGTYTWAVWARSVGATHAYDAYQVVQFNIVSPSPPTAAYLTALPASPQIAGAQVVWTAFSTGGTGPMEYQIWLYNTATYTWSIMKPYATVGNTFNWSTTGLAPGTYTWAVWARPAGATYAYDVYQMVPFVVQ